MRNGCNMHPLARWRQSSRQTVPVCRGAVIWVVRKSSSIALVHGACDIDGLVCPTYLGTQLLPPKVPSRRVRGSHVLPLIDGGLMFQKKLWYAAVAGFLIVMPCSSSAQMSTSPGTQIMIGPFVGVNYTTISGDDVSDASYKTGLAAGGQLQANFSSGLFFRTAVLYSQRGAKASIAGTKVTFKENYVEAPLLLGYTFAPPGGVRPFVMGGGQVGFKLSCDLSGSTMGTNVSVKCKETGSDFKSTDFGAVGGAGVMFPAASGTMSVDVRYALGLTDIADTSNTRHRGFTAGIAYMIPFGH